MSTVPTPPYDLLTPTPSSPAQIQLRKPIDPDDPDGPEEPDFPRKPLYREDALWGVGHRSMQEGLLDIRVVAWFGLTVGDYFEVLIKDQKDPKAFDYVRDVKSEYFLTVKKADLPEGEVPIFIRVVRSSGQESRTNTILVLIKQTLPGGKDLKFWEDWHSELKLSLEDLPEESIIDKDIVAGEVWSRIEKYPNCRKNDKLTINWGGGGVLLHGKPRRRRPRWTHSDSSPCQDYRGCHPGWNHWRRVYGSRCGRESARRELHVFQTLQGTPANG